MSSLWDVLRGAGTPIPLAIDPSSAQNSGRKESQRVKSRKKNISHRDIFPSSSSPSSSLSAMPAESADDSPSSRATNSNKFTDTNFTRKLSDGEKFREVFLHLRSTGPNFHDLDLSGVDISTNDLIVEEPEVQLIQSLHEHASMWRELDDEMIWANGRSRMK